MINKNDHLSLDSVVYCQNFFFVSRVTAFIVQEGFYFFELQCVDIWSTIEGFLE